MTDPRYNRAAQKVADEFEARTVVVLVVGTSGLIHTGHSGPKGQEIAVDALDAALDVLHPRLPVRGGIR